MSENKSEVNAQLKDVLSALLQQNQATMQQQPGSGWFNASPLPAINAINVPVKIPTPAGDVRLYLELPGELANNEQALMQALEAIAARFQLDAWQPRNQGWNNGGGGGFRRGGYGRNNYGRY